MRVVGLVLTAALATAILGSLTPTRSAVADDDPQNTYWFYNDDPRLEGPSKWWWPRTSGGWDGDYHFTFGIGNDDARDNYAIWEMGHRHGRQTIHVWVPKFPARVGATVLYRIYKNDSLIDRVWLDQREDSNKGWNRLGAWNFNGADVRVEMWDNETREHYDRNDPEDSRIGVDTIAMRCWSRCWDDSEEARGREQVPARVAVLQDDPTLYDMVGSYSWWRHEGGYNDGYHWTYSSGGSDIVDNWADWDMGTVQGTYRVEVFVPASQTHASGYAVYEILDDQLFVGRSLLNQQVLSGWQSLGEYELDGQVNIHARDNDTLDSYWEGTDNARLAIDAIRLVALSPGHTPETQRFDPQPSQQATTIQDARIRIPEALLLIYNAAAVTECRSQVIDWTVVAAVASMESHHGTYSSEGPRSVRDDGAIIDPETGEPSPILGVPLDGSMLPNGEYMYEIPVGEYAGRYGIPEDATYLRAVGPFQFLPYEFERIVERHKLPGKDPQNLFDAAHAAAAKLCFDTEWFADKSTRDSSTKSREALFNGIKRYNNSDSYVNEVLRRAEIYSAD